MRPKYLTQFGKLMMRARKLLGIVILLVVPRLMEAQLMYYWSYEEMFDKADLVVIARPLWTKDTDEYTTEPGDLRVIGVNTEFETRLVLKGKRNVKNFVLHHYRHVENKVAILNALQVLVFNPKDRDNTYLMFLIRERDGRYAPATGRDDPAAALSVLKSPRVAP
jgi:hypothetical protein